MKERKKKTVTRTWLCGARLGSLVGLAEILGLPPQSVSVKRPKWVFALGLWKGSQRVFSNRHRGGSTFSRGPQISSWSLLKRAA